MKSKRILSYTALAVFGIVAAGCASTAYEKKAVQPTPAAPVSSASDVSATDVSAINLVPGAAVKTYGWADMANGGSGIRYPDTANIVFIGEKGYRIGDGALVAYSDRLSKRMAFTNAIASGSVTSESVTLEPAIIVLTGTVDLSDGAVNDSDHSYYDAFDPETHKRLHKDIIYKIGSNKAIIGAAGARLAYGGLEAKADGEGKAQNIIIRNIEFWDAHGSTDYDTSVEQYAKKKASIDALVFNAVENPTKDSYAYVPENIWIDHCTFSDGPCSDLERNYNHDGLLDLKAGRFVTISYCEFYNHDKVTLIAPGEKFTRAEERTLTLHHNYYHEATQRMPRTRACLLHVYNNYYDSIFQYALGPGINAQFIVENNYFGKVNSSSGNGIVKYFDSSETHDTSKFYQSGNNVTIKDSDVIFDSVEKGGSFSSHAVSEAPWKIEYDYKALLQNAEELPALLPAAAGSGKITSIEINGKALAE